MALNWSDISGMAIAGGAITAASMWFINTLIDRKIMKLNGMFKRTDLCNADMKILKAEIGLVRHDLHNFIHVDSLVSGIDFKSCACEACKERRILLAELKIR